MAAELSGGVDSSSVVGTAARLLEGGTVAGSLEVHAMVFPGRPCDESPYIRAVAEHAGIAVHERTRSRPAPTRTATRSASIARCRTPRT